MRRVVFSCLVLLVGLTSFAAGRLTQTPAAPVKAGMTYVSKSGTTIKLLLDQGVLGTGDIEIGEITFVANGDSGDHPHGSTEIFYVLSGELEHVVNGRTTVLKPGMVGFVRPPDKVRHKTQQETKALVIWVPGGEAARVLGTWTPHP